MIFGTIWLLIGHFVKSAFPGTKFIGEFLIIKTLNEPKLHEMHFRGYFTM
jgi:hypothetical protein